MESQTAYINDMHIGDRFDVLDAGGNWQTGTVLGVEESKVNIKYSMRGETCTEWMLSSSKRLSNFGSKTYQPEEGKGELKLWHCIEACDIQGNWRESIVTEVKEEMVKLHFHGELSRFDEWVSRDSTRIRKYTG